MRVIIIGATGFIGRALCEEKDPERIKAIRQVHSKTHGAPDTPRHLVYFTVDKTRPLVGDKA